MLITTLTYFFMLIYTRLTRDSINVIKGQFIRGWSLTIITYILMKQYSIPIAINEPKQERLRLLRNGIGMFFNILFFFVVTKIPISETYILLQFSPFICGLGDYLLFKSQYRKAEGGLAILGAIGVILVIKPDLLFLPSSEIYSASETSYATGGERLLWRLVYFVGLVLWSFSILMVKGM